jgi:DUF3060 family protein
MSSQDDPEARIRDLERSLGERSAELTQSSSELGSGQYGAADDSRGYAAPPPADPPAYTSGYTAPPPPYSVPYPPVAMRPAVGSGRPLIIFGVVAAVLIAVIAGTVVLFANVMSSVSSTMHTFGVPIAPSTASAPSVSSEPIGPPGGDVSVSGVGGNRTIACNDSVVDISGVDNTVKLTGPCRSVTVSGVQNTVTVESAATISASGFDNRITYLSGTPQIDNSGDSNVVAKG